MFNIDSCLCFGIITCLQPCLISLNDYFNFNVLNIAGSRK
jgi:hypothetical protein